MIPALHSRKPARICVWSWRGAEPTVRPNSANPMAKPFSKLSEQETLALAIALEEEDSRIYADFAERFRKDFPDTAATLAKMQNEELEHSRRLTEKYIARFGSHIPQIHRSDVNGLAKRRPVWLMRALTVAQARRQVGVMELESRRFYEAAAARADDEGTRKLLGELALAEAEHSALAQRFESEQIASGARAREDESQRRLLVLQIVQPGLAGLMDGSVSTLAPLFAAAFATHSSRDAFLVGLAASVGAGISMGFAEALSDDGALSGRGHPLVRGSVCGLMTAAGGLGHTLPFMHRRLPRRLHHRRLRRRRGAHHHFVDTAPLHGHAVPLRGVPGHRRGPPRLLRGHADRLLLRMSPGSLENADLAPVPASRRTWRLGSYAALWISMSACVPTYMLASSLIGGRHELVGGGPHDLPRQRHRPRPDPAERPRGHPLRDPLPGLLPRLLRHAGREPPGAPARARRLRLVRDPGLDRRRGDPQDPRRLSFPRWPAARATLLGITLSQFACFMAFWAINMAVVYRGIDSIRLLLNIKAPLLIALGIVFLAWAYRSAGGFGPMLSQPSAFDPGQPKAGQFWAFFVPGLTGMIGFWATLSLNIPDFSRYAVSQRDQVLGQALGLPLAMAFYSFIGVAVTSATVVIFGQTIWNPLDVLVRFRSPAVLIVAMVALCIATLATNIAANVVSPANDFSQPGAAEDLLPDRRPDHRADRHRHDAVEARRRPVRATSSPGSSATAPSSAPSAGS